MPHTAQRKHVVFSLIGPRCGQTVIATFATTVLLTFGVLISHCDAYVPNGTESDWQQVMEVATGNALSFDLLPKELRPDLATLAERWHRMSDYKPDPAEIDRFWKKYGPEDQDLTVDNIRRVTAVLRRSKFITDNSASIKKLRKAAGESLYKKIVAQGDADPKKAVCFVAVPFPCPSQEIYTKAISFVDAASDEAKGKNVQIVVVRSPYGQKDLLKKSQAENWWWAAISDLPTRYAQPLRSGVLKLSDSFPSDTNTPWGFIFHNGELVADGNLAEWAENSSRVLKLFAVAEKK
jgi:hypothetical protein